MEKPKVCKWCYQVYLSKDKGKHRNCLKDKSNFLYLRKKSIKYDKTKGQKNDQTIVSI